MVIYRKWVLRGWRKGTKDRDARKLILKEAKILHGQYSQWRERERRILMETHNDSLTRGINAIRD
jgi:hypothetical protein